jgi:hypothetical protein
MKLILSNDREGMKNIKLTFSFIEGTIRLSGQ